MGYVFGVPKCNIAIYIILLRTEATRRPKLKAESRLVLPGLSDDHAKEEREPSYNIRRLASIIDRKIGGRRLSEYLQQFPRKRSQELDVSLRRRPSSNTEHTYIPDSQ